MKRLLGQALAWGLGRFGLGHEHLLGTLKADAWSLKPDALLLLHYLRYL